MVRVCEKHHPISYPPSHALRLIPAVYSLLLFSVNMCKMTYSSTIQDGRYTLLLVSSLAWFMWKMTSRYAYKGIYTTCFCGIRVSPSSVSSSVLDHVARSFQIWVGMTSKKLLMAWDVLGSWCEVEDKVGAFRGLEAGRANGMGDGSGPGGGNWSTMRW